MNRKERIISRLSGCGATYPTGSNMWESEVLEGGFLVGLAFGTSREAAKERASIMAKALLLKQPTE